MSNLQEAESQPLLARNPDHVEISKVQVGIMALWRICQALLFACIFPFIARMLVELGIATPKTVGFPAGLIESAFSIAILVGLYPARMLSDRYGRKITILAGLFLGSAGTAAFGFCTHLWTLVAARMLAGFGVSLIPAFAYLQSTSLRRRRTLTILRIRATSTMFFEGSVHCKSTRARYISINISALSFRNAIAPFIGGLLARPADHWPFFGRGVWSEYPYALSCLCVASIPLLSGILGFGYTKDTRERQAKNIESHNDPLGPSVTQILSGRCGAAVLIQFGIYISTYIYMVSEPLIYYTPVELGGFGLSLREMTFALGVRPIFISLSQLFLYPALARGVGIAKILRAGCLLWCCVPIGYLALGSIISIHAPPKPLVYLGIAMIYTILSLTNPIVPATTQLIVDSNAHPDHLSLLTTIMEYSNTLAAGIGAFVGSTIFRLSIEHQWLAGRAFYVFLASYVLVVAVCVRVALSSA